MSVHQTILDLLGKGIVVDPEVIKLMRSGQYVDAIQNLSLKSGQVLTKSFLEEVSSIKQFEQEPAKDQIKIEVLAHSKKIIAKDYQSKVKLLSDYQENHDLKDTTAFVKYFNDRYSKFRKFFSNRMDLNKVVSIGRYNSANAIENKISVIGMVVKKTKTKTGNTLIDIEDPTGQITVFVNSDKKIGQDKIINDEVLVFNGNISKGYLFADKILWPDIRIKSMNDIAKTIDPVAAAFISDLHFGSKKFLKEVETKFINWLKSDDKLALKIKYIFIAGDIVDGVGIYPGQMEDLEFPDIYKQYGQFEEFVQKIPEHIQIIACPGNHDAVRNAEPQPSLPKKFVPRISKLSNVHLVSNPSTINVHGIESSGVNVLLYHGHSFISLIDAIPELRQQGISKPQYVMREILKRRHLAPLYGSTTVSPEPKDHLVIEQVPDIFHSGELHSHCIDHYKGVTLINSSTWQGQTSFIDRIGHTAVPGKVSVIDLQTRAAFVKDFYQKSN